MNVDLQVFVVDDDQIILELLSGLLEGECQSEVFLSGEACLKRVAEKKPDIFLLDVNMPLRDNSSAAPASSHCADASFV